MLNDAATGEPAVVAALNLPRRPPDGHVWIKDWSENEGILAALQEAGAVQDTGEREATGYAEACLCRLLV